MKLLSLICSIVLLTSASGIAVADRSNPDQVGELWAETLSGYEIKLSWTTPNDNVGVVGYNLYRNNRYFTTVYGNSYIDDELAPNKKYRYYIVAFDEARNYSVKSSVTRANTNTSGNSPAGGSPDDGSENESGKPGVPSGLNAEVVNNSDVQLSWNQPSGFVQGYDLYRDNRYFTTVKGSTRYVDDEVSAGNTYGYQVVAFGGGEYSPKSMEVRVTTGQSVSDDQTEPVAPPPPISPPTASGTVPDGYELVFRDEFNGDSIDSNKWSSRYRWGPDWIINNEQQYYVDIINNRDFGHSPFSFGGGKMRISAIKTPDWLRGRANNQPYLSGALTTFGKFSMTYGYVEMRARLPRGKGLWPAFWLLHARNDGNRPEIDVMELLGDDTRMVYQTYHYYEGQSLRSTPSFQAPGGDYADNYYVYGMQWEPGRIIWSINGRETNRYESGNVANEEMYLLLNLALGGSWAGSPDGSTPFPATYSVDYIRAYRRR